MISFLGTYLEPISFLIFFTVLRLQCSKVRASKLHALSVFYLVAAALTLYANYLLTLPEEDPRYNNAWVYNLVFALTAPFFTYYFIHTLRTGKVRKIIGLSVLLLTGSFIYEFAAGGQSLFSSFTNSLSYFFIVLCSFIYFYETLSKVKGENILHDFDFWFISGNLLYFLGNFFIVLAWRYLASIYTGQITFEQGFQFTILWSVHNSLLFISSVVALMAHLWISYRKELS